MQRTNRSLVGQGSNTTLFYRELGVRWQAAGVMSAAALKVALSFSGSLFTEIRPHLGKKRSGARGKASSGSWKCTARKNLSCQMSISIVDCCGQMSSSIVDCCGELPRNISVARYQVQLLTAEASCPEKFLSVRCPCQLKIA